MKIEDVLKVAVPLGIAVMVFFMLKPFPPTPPKEGVEITKIEVD